MYALHLKIVLIIVYNNNYIKCFNFFELYFDNKRIIQICFVVKYFTHDYFIFNKQINSISRSGTFSLDDIDWTSVELNLCGAPSNYADTN